MNDCPTATIGRVTRFQRARQRGKAFRGRLVLAKRIASGFESAIAKRIGSGVAHHPCFADAIGDEDRDDVRWAVFAGGGGLGIRRAKRREHDHGRQISDEYATFARQVTHAELAADCGYGPHGDR